MVWLRNKKTGGLFNTEDIQKKEYSNNDFSSYNNSLKKIVDFKELKKIEEDIRNSGEGLVFRTKRAKWMAYDFTEVENGKVHYLLSDGVSSRTQNIKDLYKYIEVADRAR